MEAPFERYLEHNDYQQQLAFLLEKMYRRLEELNVMLHDMLAVPKDFVHFYYVADRSYWMCEI